jgi:hypothetical protein
VADLRRSREAHRHRTGREQPRGHRAGRGADPVAPRRAGAGVGPALDGLQLLDAERHAGQGAGVDLVAHLGVHPVRSRPGAVAVDEHERVEARVDPLDPVEALLEHVTGRQAAGAHLVRDRAGGRSVELALDRARSHLARLAVVHISHRGCW